MSVLSCSTGVVVNDGVCQLDVIALGLCGHAFLAVFVITAIEEVGGVYAARWVSMCRR